VAESDRETTAKSVAATEAGSPKPSRTVPFSAKLLEDLRQMSSERSDEAAWEEALGNLSMAGLIALMEELDAIKDSRPDRSVLQQAMAELARRDPEQALQWFTPEKQEENLDFWSHAAREIAGSNYGLLEDWVQTNLEREEAGLGARYALMALPAIQWVQGGAEAFAFYTRLPDGSLYPNDAINQFFGEFAQEDPQGAMAAAKAFAVESEAFTSRDLDYALYLTAMSVGPEDSDLVTEIISQMEEPRTRRNSWLVYYREVFESDSERGIAELRKIERPKLAELLSGVDFGSNLIADVGQGDSELLFDAVREIPISDSTRSVFVEAVRVLTEENPELATSLIDGIPEGPMKRDLQGKNLSVLAASDPDQALVDFRKLPEGEMREQAFQQLGNEVWDKERGEVLALAKDLSPGDWKPFLGAALPRLIEENSRGVAQAFEGGAINLEQDLPEEMVGELAKALSEDNGEYSRKWFQALPEELQPVAMRGRSEAMLQSDPAELMRSLETMPKNESWAEGVRVLVADLESADPATAEAWQTTLEEEGFAK
jgi:hypothetical protein